MSSTFASATTPAGSAVRPHYLRLLKAQEIPGYLPGWRQPVVLAQFQLLAAAPDTVLSSFVNLMERRFGPLPSPGDCVEFSRWPVLRCTAAAVLAILQQAAWPVLGKVTIMKGGSGQAEDRVALALPSLQGAGHGLMLALEEALGSLYTLAGGGTLAKELDDSVRKRLQPIAALTPKGMNTLRFIEAAHAQGVPWKRLNGNVYQFGWGARARWLDSSCTDVTPGISMKLSRDKRATTGVLRQAGLPVPPHRAVASEAEALQVAERLGYPVVVKPANLDRGAGVFAHLTSPADVKRAFASARSLSPQILVEKHVFGNDYRLQVFQGEVFWVTQRVPAGVTGDGQRSVRALVDAVNADPRRAGPESTGLKRIVLDTETDTWLTRQGLTLDSVPAAGQVVRLRGAANVASGGTIAPVPLAEVHPDNLALAARAARVLRLDVAGIDLLIPDIARSWLESGAGICEVNSQPQMSPHLPAALLPRLVKGQGRIPVVVVLGGTRGSPDCDLLFDTLGTLRSGLGMASRGGVWLDGRQIVRGPLSGFKAGLCLLEDPAVHAVVLHVEASDLLESGSPVDSIDHLVLAGPLPYSSPHPPPHAPPQGAVETVDWTATLLLATWLGAMSRKVWLLDSASEWQGQAVPQTRSEIHSLLDAVAASFQTGDDR